MKDEKLSPGDVVVTNFGIYEHWSIVSDKKCDEGLPMLISATKRNGTVKEESWSKTTEGKDTRVVEIKSDKTVVQILDDARLEIGKWTYSLHSKNCEHFVNWSLGLKMESIQVNKAIFGSIIGCVLMAIGSKRPTLLKSLSGAILIGGLALATNKAVEKE